MALNLDVSELTQAAAMKATPHDNCVVLDLGTGTFPRDIEVRLPDDDGARQNALWDGSLNLSVNDEVLCFEYSGLSAWRVMGMGGNDGGAGKVRVSEVWESDFGAVALQSDADGKIGIGTAGPDAKLEALTTAGAQLRLTFENEVKFADFTVDANHNLAIDPTSTGEIKLNATVTVLDEIQRKGDADTKVSFTDDKFSLTVGGLLMLEAVEIAGQDTLDLGDVGGGGDVDINLSDGQAFLQGSTGRLGIGTITPGNVSGGTGVSCHVMTQGDTFPAFRMERENAGAFTDRAWAFGVSTDGTWFVQDATAPANRILVNTSGLIGFGPGQAPEGSLHGYTDDNDVGWMWTSANGVNATPTELKANDARDVIRILSYETIGYDGGDTEKSTGSLTPGNQAEIFNDGTDIFQLRVNAGGDIDVRRTSGASILQVGLKLMWI
ncbi:hypothetical protein LCGC14_1021090 [marine sediment metagenome]|uniref:Uncharacterized protein n=2 Tax=marine sediment metagenome TaxID=412755 RepID=A0A0F9QFG7_9ZZZZ